jgi:hypothetical protein
MVGCSLGNTIDATPLSFLGVFLRNYETRWLNRAADLH